MGAIFLRVFSELAARSVYSSSGASIFWNHSCGALLTVKPSKVSPSHGSSSPSHSKRSVKVCSEASTHEYLEGF